MYFNEIDLSTENDELLSIIEKNYKLACSARREIQNAKQLLSQKKSEPCVDTSSIRGFNNISSIVEKKDDEFEEEVRCYIQDFNSLDIGFDESDLFDILPSMKSYRFKDIVLRLIAESNRDINDLRNITNDISISSADLDEAKELILHEKRKVDILKSIMSEKNEEKKEFIDEKNELILVPTSSGNIRVLSEIEDMPIEYIPLFKELFDSIVDGTFKGLKSFNNNNAFSGFREVRGNGVRVVFKRLSKKKYAIVTAFIKRTTNDAGYRDALKSKINSFRAVQDKIKENLDNEEFIRENNLNVRELYNLLGTEEKDVQYEKGGI